MQYLSVDFEQSIKVIRLMNKDYTENLNQDEQVLHHSTQGAQVLAEALDDILALKLIPATHPVFAKIQAGRNHHIAVQGLEDEEKHRHKGVVSACDDTLPALIKTLKVLNDLGPALLDLMDGMAKIQKVARNG